MSVNGSKTLLKIGNQVVIGQTSSSFDATRDEIEKTTKQSGGYKEFEAGERSATGSCDVRVKASDGADVVALYDQLNSEETFDFEEGTGVAGDVIISGKAIMTGISKSDPQNDSRTLSISYRPTGVFTASVITA